MGIRANEEVKQFAQAVDFYLSEEGKPYAEELNRVACMPSTDETDSLMLGYALEGIRLAGTFGSYREVAEEDVIVEDDGREVPVKAGDRVFVSFVSCPSSPHPLSTRLKRHPPRPPIARQVKGRQPLTSPRSPPPSTPPSTPTPRRSTPAVTAPPTSSTASARTRAWAATRPRWRSRSCSAPCSAGATCGGCRVRRGTSRRWPGRAGSLCTWVRTGVGFRLSLRR